MGHQITSRSRDAVAISVPVGVVSGASAPLLDNNAGDSMTMGASLSKKSEGGGGQKRRKSYAEIREGNVLEELPKVHGNTKFDLVIADPPYNIGKDFGNNHDCMPQDDYAAWCRSWLEQCFRLLKNNGLIYVYGLPEILAHVAVQYSLDSQRWLAWHYTNKTVHSSKFWQRSHETILCLWQPGQKAPALEIDQIRVPYSDNYRKCAGKPRKDTAGRFSRGGTATVYRDYGGALPRDVIQVAALAGGAGRKERWFYCRTCGKACPPDQQAKHDTHDIIKHPTQKPLELTKRLLRSRIKEGAKGKVLVPFAGTGSECVAAKQLGIGYLGVELNPEFVSFARSWVGQCTS